MYTINNNSEYELIIKNSRFICLLYKINSPIALAYWFMDDGTYNGCIATDSFSLEEDKLLQKWLFKKWNIITTL